MQYILYIFLVLPFLFGVYAIHTRRKDFGIYLIGYSFLGALQEICKLFLLNQPKPYIGSNFILFAIQIIAYIVTPAWLLYCIAKSYHSTIITKLSILIAISASIGILWAYPEVRGIELVKSYYWYHLRIFIVCIAYFAYEIHKHKLNANQFLLLTGLLAGCIQITFLIIFPGSYYHWISLGMFYIAISIQLFLLKHYY